MHSLVHCVLSLFLKSVIDVTELTQLYNFCDIALVSKCKNAHTHILHAFYFAYIYKLIYRSR